MTLWSLANRVSTTWAKLVSYLLKEDGGYLLTEDGYKIVLEDSTGNRANTSWAQATKN